MKMKMNHLSTDLNSNEHNWIIELAKGELAEHPSLVDELKKCRTGWWADPAVLQFISDNEASDFDESIETALHPEFGSVVIDILQDARVYAITFMSGIYD